VHVVALVTLLFKILILSLHVVDVFLNRPVLLIHELNVFRCVFQNLSTRRLQ